LSISAQAQIVIPGRNGPPPFPQIKSYLGLTDAQIAQIVLNVSAYSRLIAQRQQRIYQVQSEIQQETARSPLEPAALGVRYAEIEAICRNVNDEAAAAQNRNLALLTDTQKAKLKVLDDASKLLPIITETQSAGVLAPPGPDSPFSGFFKDNRNTTQVMSGCQSPSAVYDPSTRKLFP